MKTIKHIVNLVMLMAVLPCLFSCGEMFEDMPPIQSAFDMSFDRHAMTIMEGDSCHIQLCFTPDSVSNQSAYWWAEHPERVILRNNGTVIGQSEGLTDVMAISLSSNISDTCKVNVLSNWIKERVPSLPYDMIVNAAVQIDGKPINSSQCIAAYCGPQLRGVGSLRREHNIDYLMLRIYSPSPAGETITLYYYDRTHYRVVPAAESLIFKETTLGTLSALYPIRFNTYE